jgi:hypothetical protein
VKDGVQEIDVALETELVNFVGEELGDVECAAVLFGVEPEVEEDENELERLAAVVGEVLGKEAEDGLEEKDDGEDGPVGAP